MEGSAKILSLIARDEATHLNLSTNVIKAWQKGDDPEMTKAMKRHREDCDTKCSKTVWKKKKHGQNICSKMDQL